MSKAIDIAGMLNAATTEGIIAKSEQISYNDSDVNETLNILTSKVDGIIAGGGGGELDIVTNDDIDNIFNN